MGIGFLKKLIQEAKDAKDVITLEATVITGFEFQALDECKEKCKPLNCSKSKGRIFFNIKKESYPNVLKMRMIDNVFLVSESFEELKLKKVKDEDLSTIKNLVDQVDWGKSVPVWAEIVGFKGVQFPKCARKEPNEPLDENEPSCQSCLIAKAGGGGGLAQSEDDGGSSAETADSAKKDVDSPKVDMISDEQVFQTPPDKCAFTPECKVTEPAENESSTGDAEVQDGSALGSSSEVNLLEAKATVETDDESAFHSAEEDPLIEEPADKVSPGEPVDEVRCPEKEPLYTTDTDAPDSSSICSGQTKSDNDASNEATVEIVGPKVAKYEDRKAKDKGREVRERPWKSADIETVGVAKPGEGPKRDPHCDTRGSDKAESNDATSQNGSEPAERPADQAAPKGEKKKSYWQRRKEAKAKKAAEAKAKKPPRKAYVDDGIMKFRVTCYRNGPKHSFDSNDAAGHFGGLINDKFHWTVDLTRHDINVVLVIEDDSAYVTLALTNKSLHKRNITHFGPTTLRATLCYGLLRLAEPCPGEIVMDPMCGGGSIPIEGALAFTRMFYICGDVNAKCVAQTGDNIAHNSKERPLPVDVLQWSVRRLPLRDSAIDVFVTDLPFGLRVGKQKDNTGLYTAALTEAARVVRTCGRASLLTYDRTAMIRALQRTRHLWREIRVTMVNQGGLRCFAYLLLRRARDSVPLQELPEHGLQGPVIPESGAVTGERSSEPSVLIQTPAFQVPVIDEPKALPGELSSEQSELIQAPVLQDPVNDGPNALPGQRSSEPPEPIQTVVLSPVTPSELIQELALQDTEIAKPADLPTESPQLGSDEKYTDDTQRA